jgi:hypothetical protein
LLMQLKSKLSELNLICTIAGAFAAHTPLAAAHSGGQCHTAKAVVMSIQTARE